MRKNRKLRKILLTVCSAILLVCISVGATIAYLTDTEAVTNTFTVGQVAITLDEGDVHELNEAGTTDENVGKHIDEGKTRVKENKYRLIPGGVYDKDPTIHLTADTDTADYQDAYVVAKITVNKALELLELLPADPDTIGIKDIVTDGVLAEEYAKTKDEAEWIYTDDNGVKQIALTQEVDTDSDSIVFMVYWLQPQQPGDNLVIFKNLKIPTSWDNEDIDGLQGMEIKVNAYAIQAAGFDNVYEAYAAGDWTK